MFLISQFPALQVIIPFCCALISVFTFNSRMSWMISLLSSIATLYISYSLFYQSLDYDIYYIFGGFEAPFGIEYKLDSLNQTLILFINIIFFIFIAFNNNLVKQDALLKIVPERKHIYYSLLLFAYSGYSGVLCTGDLFNLYVFIEISSLATYAIIATSRDKRALIGAFDYLIIGTIGATLILISIGYILALTGSLNIKDITSFIQQENHSNALLIAFCFYITGAIVKIAFMPMHFWLIRSYSYTAPINLTYLAPVATTVGIYILARFMNIAGENTHLELMFENILYPLSLIVIVVSGIFAITQTNLKRIIIYSSLSQGGYLILLLSHHETRSIALQLLILDGFNKLALFTIISHLSVKLDCFEIDNFKAIKNSLLFKTLCGLAFIYSASLPISGMFIIKVKIFETLYYENLFLAFVIIMISSIFNLLYHIKIIRAIYFTPIKNTVTIDSNLLGLFCIVGLQIATTFYFNEIDILVTTIQSKVGL